MSIRKRGKDGNSYEVRIIRKKILQKIGIKNGIYTLTVSSEFDAIRQHDALCRDLDAGIIPECIHEYARSLVTTNKMTVGDMYRMMLSDPNYHASESTETLINRIYDDVEDIVMVDYDRQALIEWINTMKIANNAPGTIRKKVGALRSIFVYAVTCENPLLMRNVFDTLPKDYSLHKNHKNRHDAGVKRDAIRDRRLIDGEEELLIKAIEEYRLDPRRASIGEKFKPSLHLLFNIAINTGMRLQEIFLIQWNNIDFDHGIFNLPANITKGHKFRQVPMTKALLPKMLDYKEKYFTLDSDTVLPFFAYYECSREKCSEGLSSTWRRISNNAGIEDLHFHDLRHEGVSRMVEKSKLSLTQLQKIAGHGDSRTFDRYNNLRTENLTSNFY